MQLVVMMAFQAWSVIYPGPERRIKCGVTGVKVLAIGFLTKGLICTIILYICNRQGDHGYFIQPFTAKPKENH